MTFVRCRACLRKSPASRRVREPPPHAKAHGWRKMNDPSYVGYTGKKWDHDYGVIKGRCNTAAVGAVLGGAVGSRADKGQRPAAGRARHGDRCSHRRQDRPGGYESYRACMGHSLELAGVKTTVVWQSEVTGVTLTVTQTRKLAAGREACRQFTTELTVGKGKRKKENVTGVACRHSNGDWVFKA